MPLSQWRRLRHRTLERRIIEVLAVDPNVWLPGLDLLRAARLRAGRFYPALGRLERANLVQAKWDEDEPVERKRRRLYRLNPPTAFARTGDGHLEPIGLRYIGIGGPEDLHTWVPAEPIRIVGDEVSLAVGHLPGVTAVGMGVLMPARRGVLAGGGWFRRHHRPAPGVRRPTS